MTDIQCTCGSYILYLAEPAKYIPDPSMPGSLRQPPKSSTTIFGSSRPLQNGVREGGRERGREGARERERDRDMFIDGRYAYNMYMYVHVHVLVLLQWVREGGGKGERGSYRSCMYTCIIHTCTVCTRTCTCTTAWCYTDAIIYWYYWSYYTRGVVTVCYRDNIPTKFCTGEEWKRSCLL